MNKKRLAKAQFEELHVEEVEKDGKESVKIIENRKALSGTFGSSTSTFIANKKL